MATVRRWQSQVEQAGLPGPRPAQPDNSGLSTLASATTQAAVLESEAQSRELEKARQARLTDAFAQLASNRNDIELTVAQQKGKSALESDLVNQSTQLLDQHAEKISSDLKDPELESRFKKIALEQRLQLVASSRLHVANESTAFQQKAFEDGVTMASEDAKKAALLGDAAGAAAKLGTLRGLVDAHAVAQGWDTINKDRAMEAATSPTHLGVVKGFLAGESPRPDLASAYLREHRAEMSVAAQSEAETELRPISLAVKSEKTANSILEAARDPKTGVVSAERAAEAVRQLPDEDLVKPAVRQRVHQALAEQTAIQIDGASRAASTLSALYEQNGHNLAAAAATPEGARAKAFLLDARNGLTSQQHWQQLEAIQHADIQRAKETKAPKEEVDVAPWVKFLGDSASPDQQERIAAMTPEAFHSLYILGIDPKTGVAVRPPMPKEFRPQAAAHFGAIKQNGTKEALPEKLILQRMRVAQQAPDANHGDVKADDPSTWPPPDQARFAYVRDQVRKALETHKALNEGATPKDEDTWTGWIDRSLITVQQKGHWWGTNTVELPKVGTIPAYQGRPIVGFEGSIPKVDQTIVDNEILTYNRLHPEAPKTLDDATRRSTYVKLLRLRAGQPLEDPK